MAKKRTKQKQAKKQQQKAQPKQQTYRQKQDQLRAEKLAREHQITQEQARKLQSYNRQQREQMLREMRAVEKKEVERQKRRDRDRRREQNNIDTLVAAGYTSEEAYKYRRKNQTEVQSLVQAMQTGGDYMLVFVRDKTGGRVDAITGEGTGEWSEAIYWQKQMAKGLGVKSLLSGINAALEGMDSVGNIGEAIIDVVPESHIEQTINFRARQDYFLVYRGQGRSYKSLVSLINNVMSFLYLRSQRDVFIQDLHDNLYNLGNAAARKNAARIKREFL